MDRLRGKKGERESWSETDIGRREEHREKGERGDTGRKGEGGEVRGAPGSEFMVHGSRFAVHGSRFAIHGSRFTVHGSRFAVHGSWFTIRREREGERKADVKGRREGGKRERGMESERE